MHTSTVVDYFQSYIDADGEDAKGHFQVNSLQTVCTFANVDYSVTSQLLTYVHWQQYHSTVWYDIVGRL